MLDEGALRSISEEWDAELIRKNKDYGDSFNDLRFETGVSNIVDRLKEKIMRYEQVSKNGNLVDDESAKDTLKDIANYCKLEYLYIDNLDTYKFSRASELLEGTMYTVVVE